MIRITKQSYDLLTEAGALAWSEDDKYYSDIALIAEEHQAMYIEAPKYLIYQYVNPGLFGLTEYDHPGNIVFPDQLNQNLYKDYKLYYGEKINSTFYAEYDLENGQLFKPVVKVDYVYHRGEDYLLKYKERTVTWAYEDGTWSDVVQTDIIPYLTNAKKLHEIKIVRANVTEEAESLAKQLGLFEYVQQLFEKYLDHITLYKEAGSPKFAQDILNDQEHAGWLDQRTPDDKMTVREFLYSFFMIATKQENPSQDPTV